MREHLNYFRSFLGETQVASAKTELIEYGNDSCPEFKGEAGLVLFPQTYDEVSRVLSYCHQNLLAVVPSGGRTGYSGGATATRSEIVLSLSKLNKILEVDRQAATLVCQAGALTEAVQNSAMSQGLYYPVDFASKGSSQIGGNLATNAGGIRVVRYGSTRDWVLGMKAVLASGEILELNGALVKNRSGYDLHQLLMGSEGTLAVIVEATLKLCYPPPQSRLAFCAVADLTRGLEAFSALLSEGYVVNVFEFLDALSLRKVLEHKQSSKAPFQESYPYYLVIEVDAQPKFEERVAKFLEDGVFANAVVAQSSIQARELMSLREQISESIRVFPPHKNDLSVPLKNIPSFVDKLGALLNKLYPDFEFALFGHIGDGNIHLNVLKPPGLQVPEFLSVVHAREPEIFELTQSMGGSVSAEHGIGLAKKSALKFVRSASEIQLMQGIKRVFDPNHILNPGKIW